MEHFFTVTSEFGYEFVEVVSISVLEEVSGDFILADTSSSETFVVGSELM